MESLQIIKSRRKAVKNIGQITKAMEVVSATKMRRAQEAALSSRPYAYKVLELLARLGKETPVQTIYNTPRPIKTTLVLVIASDRGLAGSFNTQIVKTVEMFLRNDQETRNNNQALVLAGIGKKIFSYLDKKSHRVVNRFAGFGDYTAPKELDTLIEFVISGFLKGEWDRVVTISMHFRTTLKQDVLTREILPIDIEKIHESIREIIPEHGRYADESKWQIANGKSPNETEYIYEPSPKEALEALFPHLLKMQIYHLMLEANASEHSARMVAMKNATDNAEELSGELALIYNKARQAGITKELIEITSTQSALLN